MTVPLPPPVTGDSFDLSTATGGVTCWTAGPEQSDAPPLVLVHTVNAAASAYEVAPLFEHFSKTRRVVAPELPGFGHSARPDQRYTPRQMTDAVLAAVTATTERYGPGPVDAMAVSLGCEFLARAAVEAPAQFRRLGLISPTGFDARSRRIALEDEARGDDAIATRGRDFAYALFAGKPWSKAFFTLLTSRPSLRFFLGKTFGAKAVDPALVEYAWQTSHQPGARHAPYVFVSGFLFSKHAFALYEALTQPVWMVHGTRGDFVDYSRRSELAGRPNWRIDEMEGGALPHFEQLNEVVASWDAAGVAES